MYRIWTLVLTDWSKVMTQPELINHFANVLSSRFEVEGDELQLLYDNFTTGLQVLENGAHEWLDPERSLQDIRTRIM